MAPFCSNLTHCQYATNLTVLTVKNILFISCEVCKHSVAMATLLLTVSIILVASIVTGSIANSLLYRD